MIFSGGTEPGTGRVLGPHRRHRPADSEDVHRRVGGGGLRAAHVHAAPVQHSSCRQDSRRAGQPLGATQDAGWTEKGLSVRCSRKI